MRAVLHAEQSHASSLVGALLGHVGAVDVAGAGDGLVVEDRNLVVVDGGGD